MGTRALVAVIVAAFAITLIIWGIWLIWLDRHARRCPGWRSPWRRWLSPLDWFFVRGCRYNLYGLRGDVIGALTCPECGTHIVSRRRMLRTNRRWRRVMTGLCGLACALAVWQSSAIHRQELIHRLPNDVLIAVEQYFKERTPTILRRELRQRLVDGRLGDRQRRWIMPLLVHDLKADSIVFNGQISAHELSDMFETAHSALEAAMLSTDWQQRQLAADVIRRHDPDYPSDALLRVTVEGLRDDRLPYDWNSGSCNFVFNARDGVRFLAHHAERAEPFLAEGMNSSDVQQQFLSAVAVGLGGRLALAEQAVPILADHLRNNLIAEDAKLATVALHGFGPEVVPLLEPLLDSADRQQRQLAEYLIRRLTTDAAPADLATQLPAARVSARTFDPTSTPIDEVDIPEY